MVFACHFYWLFLCLPWTFLLFLDAWFWIIWAFPVHFRAFFLLDFNGGWFFKFFVLLDSPKFGVECNRSLIFLEQRPKINFLEKFPLAIKGSIDISFILLEILDELFLPKIEFMVLAAKRVELVGRDGEIIDDSIVLKLKLVIVLLEFLYKPIDENGQMLRFISDWCFKLIDLFGCWFFLSKLIYFFLASQFLYVFGVYKFIDIGFKLVFEQVQDFCLF